ncbi:hypothetical protein D9611_010431 [Ephemerocybe angulata]|uniref:Uncharacterized protein n=1 Tax=Ephemerocybe angulata TaxID=980116 RepID=A0A8H5BVG6_9AGAR|nr:hypothetical protein D9611_010431 [Tulosesus angulatus]
MFSDAQGLNFQGPQSFNSIGRDMHTHTISPTINLNFNVSDVHSSSARQEFAPIDITGKVGTLPKLAVSTTPRHTGDLGVQLLRRILLSLITTLIHIFQLGETSHGSPRSAPNDTGLETPKEPSESPDLSDDSEEDCRLRAIEELDDRFLEMQKLTTPEVYVASMLGSGKGLACWQPRPRQPFAGESLRGVIPGDVGIFHPESGFKRSFNLWEDEASLREEYGAVASSETPYQSPHRRVAVYEEELKKDDILVQGAACEMVYWDDPRRLASFNFHCRAPQGAALVSTSPADLEELVDHSVLKGHIIQHAELIYKHANSVRTIAEDESIYIVTGCIRSDSWALAAYKDATAYDVLKLEKQYSDPLVPYAWTQRGTSEARIGVSRGIKDQTLFLRGYKLGFSKEFRSRMQAHLDQAGNSKGKGEGPSTPEFPDTPNTGSRDNGNSHSSLPRGEGHGYEKSNTSGCQSPKDQCELNDAGSGMTLALFPDNGRKQSCHPCDVITDYLLENAPNADFALSHDDDWRHRLKGRAFSLSKDGMLNDVVPEISNSKKISVRHGVAFLDMNNTRENTEDGIMVNGPEFDESIQEPLNEVAIAATEAQTANHEKDQPGADDFWDVPCGYPATALVNVLLQHSAIELQKNNRNTNTSLELWKEYVHVMKGIISSIEMVEASDTPEQWEAFDAYTDAIGPLESQLFAWLDCHHPDSLALPSIPESDHDASNNILTFMADWVAGRQKYIDTCRELEAPHFRRVTSGHRATQVELRKALRKDDEIALDELVENILKCSWNCGSPPDEGSVAAIRAKVRSIHTAVAALNPEDHERTGKVIFALMAVYIPFVEEQSEDDVNGLAWSKQVWAATEVFVNEIEDFAQGTTMTVQQFDEKWATYRRVLLRDPVETAPQAKDAPRNKVEGDSTTNQSDSLNSSAVDDGCAFGSLESMTTTGSESKPDNLHSIQRSSTVTTPTKSEKVERTPNGSLGCPSVNHGQAVPESNVVAIMPDEDGRRVSSRENENEFGPYVYGYPSPPEGDSSRGEERGQVEDKSSGTGDISVRDDQRDKISNLNPSHRSNCHTATMINVDPQLKQRPCLVTTRRAMRLKPSLKALGMLSELVRLLQDDVHKEEKARLSGPRCDSSRSTRRRTRNMLLISALWDSVS